MGASAACAISWWKGMASDGGASLAVTTRPVTATRGAALSEASKGARRSAWPKAEKWSGW